jgi:hypothetical protein
MPGGLAWHHAFTSILRRLLPAMRQYVAMKQLPLPIGCRIPNVLHPK